MSRLLSWLGLLITLLPAVTAAQATTATVSGRVLDAANGSPIPFVSIIVEMPAGQQLSGALTAENGRFQIQGLPPGTYKVTMTFPGFQPADTDVLVSTLNQAYDLGDIRLPRLQNFEDTIAVTADAIRVAGTDTQVFRLDAGPAQSTGSLLDALKGLPGVTIDQEGKVLLRGSERVAILIDGRPSSLTGFGSNQRGLDSVTAGNVEAIEIISNPSARFDAAGMAGIINIIYKQQEQLGFSGEIGAGLAVGQFTKQRADLPTELGSFSSNGKLLPNVSLNYRTPTVRTFFQGELLLQHDLPNNEFTTRTYDDGRVLESQVPENREQYYYTVRFGADWKVSSARTLTVSGIHDFEEHIDRAQVPFILQPSGVRERFWFWRERETTGFTNFNADFRHQFSTPGHSLGINLQYTRGKEDEAYFLNEVSPVRVGTDDTHLVAIENTLPLSLDYTRPMRAGRLELGAKLQRRWIPLTYTVGRGVQSVIYDGLGDFSDWDEDIYAGYANFIYLKPAYTVEAGLRVEQTNVSYTIPSENIYYPGSDSYDYFEAFPNLKFTYRLSAANRLVGAYNRRVDRPGEPELRIFPKYDDPELLKVGNPFLRPQFTNVVEGSFVRSWAGGSGNVALYHRDIDDAFSRIFAIDSSNPNYDIVNRLYENAGSTTQTGVQLLADHAVSKTWRASGGVNVYRNAVEAFETILLFPTPRPFALAATTETTWDASVNNQFRLPRAVELNANFIYYAGRNVPQGRERDRSSLDLSAKWPLRGDRAELLFTFTDVFNDFAVEREVAGQGFTALYQNFLETQVATVTLKVRF